MRIMWKQHSQEEDWGFLLIDTRNALNKDNRTEMLWRVRHEWTSGARFSFSCYRHWATLMIRAVNGTCHFLYINKGVTQRDPLEMVAHGLGPLPSHPSYGTYRLPTSASLSHSIWMMLGRAAH